MLLVGNVSCYAAKQLQANSLIFELVIKNSIQAEAGHFGGRVYQLRMRAWGTADAAAADASTDIQPSQRHSSFNQSTVGLLSVCVCFGQ